MRRSSEAMQRVLSPSVINWPPTKLESNLLGPLTRAPLRQVFIMTDYREGRSATQERSPTDRGSSFRGGSTSKVQNGPGRFSARYIASSDRCPGDHHPSHCKKTFTTILHPASSQNDLTGHPPPDASGTVNHRRRRCRFTGGRCDFGGDSKSETRPRRVIYVPPLLQKMTRATGKWTKLQFFQEFWAGLADAGGDL